MIDQDKAGPGIATALSSRRGPFASWIEDPDGLTRAALAGGTTFHEALAEAAATSKAHGALLREEIVAAAGLSANGDLVVTDERFLTWFSPAVVNRSLAERLANHGGSAPHLFVEPDGRASLFAYGRADAASTWVLPGPIREALDDGRAGVIVLGAAPSRARRHQLDASRAFGLSTLEAKLVAALIDTGNLPDAARAIGLRYSSARDAIASALKRTGARRQADLVAKVLALSVGAWRQPQDTSTLLIDAFGLSIRQANIALHLTEGLTREQVARALKVSSTIVKDDLTRVFARTHVSTAAELARVVTETSALAALTSATSGEFASRSETMEPVRFIARPADQGGGWIAISDYGPRSGDPVLVLHSGGTSRHVARSLVRAMQAAGLRPIGIDRPGFGLSDLQPNIANPFTAASKDMETVCHALGSREVRILARGGGKAVYEFAASSSVKISRVVCINPDAPVQQIGMKTGILSNIKSAILGHPASISRFAQIIMGHSSLALIERTLRVALAESPADLAIFENPSELQDFARSIRLLAAGNVDGFVAEQTQHSFPWAPPPLPSGRTWTLISGEQDPLHNPEQGITFWESLVPGCKTLRLKDAGRFPHLSHTSEVVAAVLA